MGKKVTLWLLVRVFQKLGSIGIFLHNYKYLEFTENGLRKYPANISYLGKMSC